MGSEGSEEVGAACVEGVIGRCGYMSWSGEGRLESVQAEAEIVKLFAGSGQGSRRSVGV